MTTILFYNFILFSSTFFVWLSEKGRTSIDRWVLLGIAFLIVFLPSALRYGIGTDFYEYINIFENPELSEWREQGFHFINVVLQWLGLTPQWAIATYAFIFTIIAFIGLPKSSKWLPFLLLFLFSYFNSFNIIRQMISLSFTFLAIRFFLDKRVVLFCFALIFGGLFHKAVLVLIPLGLFATLNLHRSVQYRFIPIVMFVFLVFVYFKLELVFNLIHNALLFFKFNDIASYFNSDHFISKNFGSEMGNWGRLFFSLYVLLFSKNLIEANSNNKFLIYMVFFYALFTILTMNIVIFARAIHLFEAGIIYSYWVIWKLEKNRDLNCLMVFLFLLFGVIFYFYKSLSFTTIYSDPMLNPYCTIFNFCI